MEQEQTPIEQLTSEQIDEIVKSINMTPVISSNIVAIGYNENNKVLRVVFKGNSSYIYFNVEKEVYNLIASSESKGKQLNESVVRNKEKYKYLKVR